MQHTDTSACARRTKPCACSTHMQARARDARATARARAPTRPQQRPLGQGQRGNHRSDSARRLFRRPALQTNRKRAHSSGPLTRASEGKPRSDYEIQNSRSCRKTLVVASRVFLQLLEFCISNTPPAASEGKSRSDSARRLHDEPRRSEWPSPPERDKTPRSEYFSDGLRSKQTAGAPTASRVRTSTAGAARATKTVWARSPPRSRTHPRAHTHGLVVSERKTPGERAKHSRRASDEPKRHPDDEGNEADCLCCVRRCAKMCEGARKCAAP